MEKQKRRPYLMTWVTALAIVVVALAAAMVIRGVMAADDGTDIGSEKAKSIALSDADLSADDVTFTKSSLQTEDGKNIYEVDFYTDEKEYDYEIDAATGAVIAKDEDQKKIIVTMPASDIVAVTIDKDTFKIYSEKESLWNPLKLEDYNISLVEFENAAKAKALASGILKRSDEQARNLVREFIVSLPNTSEYVIEFK